MCVHHSHDYYVGVAYLYHGIPMVAFHHGMPFGATASVLAWHKVGGLIQKIARVILHALVYRYVDDYFAAERLCTRSLLSL